MDPLRHSPRRFALASPFLLGGFALAAFAISNLFAIDRAKVLPVKPNVTGPTPFSGTYDPHQFPCASARHAFTVPAGEVRVLVTATATVPANDITVSLLFGAGANPVFIDTEDTGTFSEALIWEPAGGVPAGTYQVQVCQTPNTSGVPQNAPFTYNGTFATDNTQTPGGVLPPQFGPIAPAPVDNGPKSGYEIFQPPGQLINVVSSSQGPTANTVEYLGRDAGEPSMGVSWQSAQDPVNGITAFQSDLQTLFAKFDDGCPASGTNATWYSSQAPTSQFVNSDPIGFVDSITGRVFAGQLTLLSPTCKISYTSTDGKDPLGNPGPQGWVATTGPLGSGVDHQTIGGGPYHAPIPSLPTPYPHAVYYASQDLVTAFAFRSDDGGATFTGPYVMYTSECGGLHGHLKVTPNTTATAANGKAGTVFLPNNSCGDNDGAVVISETNGINWSVRPVSQTTSNPNFQDPAVSIDANGRVYFAMSSFVAAGPAGPGGAQLVIGFSDDNGVTWHNLYDVSSGLGLKNVMYPAAVAGDAGRAAVAFFGASVGGDPTVPSYTGVWHLYVAHTFDGGAHWTVTDATPNDPIQRGPIWAHGAADIARNMLDFFDMGVDKQGRVQVGFADGCVDGHCVQASNAASGNGYADRTTIARQSSGRRMFAANDPQSATEAPGMPIVSAKRIGPTVTLSWSLGDEGNSPITGYQILRGTASGAETPLISVQPNQLTLADSTATDPTRTYYYKVLAVNAVGTSCGNNEIAVPYVGDTCSGLIVQKTPPNHPEQPLQGAAPQSLAIDYVAVAEPPTTSNLVFKMKVTNMGATPPASSRWRIVWNSYNATAYDPTAQQFYVGMSTDGNSVVKYEWGTLATAVVGLVLGVPTETERGLLPGSSFSPDGTITLVIPKATVGNPQAGDLLGAVNGRTFTGDTSESENLQRSTALIDHTFVKAQRDNGEPAATYSLVGNTTCPAVGLAPINAVSRKTHGDRGDFDVVLPLVGSPGVESRRSGASGDAHRIVITFASPVTVGNTSLSGIGTISNVSVNGSVVTVDLTGVTNQQTITLNLLNVSDTVNTGNVAVPMGVLLGDVNADRTTNSGDAILTRNRSGQLADPLNFRSDVNTDGTVNSGDAFIVRARSGTSLDTPQ